MAGPARLDLGGAPDPGLRGVHQAGGVRGVAGVAGHLAGVGVVLREAGRLVAVHASTVHLLPAGSLVQLRRRPDPVGAVAGPAGGVRTLLPLGVDALPPGRPRLVVAVGAAGGPGPLRLVGEPAVAGVALAAGHAVVARARQVRRPDQHPPGLGQRLAGLLSEQLQLAVAAHAGGVLGLRRGRGRRRRPQQRQGRREEGGAPAGDREGSAHASTPYFSIRLRIW